MSTALYDPIKAMSKVTDSVIVAFSCGKESIVTLDLCCRYFKNVKAFFMYMCPDLSFQEKAIAWYEKKYGIEITRLPHMDTSIMFRYGGFRCEDWSCPIISINDVYHFMRVNKDIWWIAAGERIDDSIVRRAMMKHSGSIDVQRGRLYPVAAWNKKEIMEYIKFHKLYRDGFSRLTGHSFTTRDSDLYIVKEHFPEDYEKIIRVYPFAEASVKRYEIYGKDKVSEL